MADQNTLPQTANQNLTGPNPNDSSTAGAPTIAPLARSVVANTFIDKANHALAHSCDFISELQHNRSTDAGQTMSEEDRSIEEGINELNN